MEDPVVAQCTGFVGASNRLYKQKWRDQFEALVENSNLLFADKSLERLVSPTQADLRYDERTERKLEIPVELKIW